MSEPTFSPHAPVLRLSALAKRYGNVVALDGVDLAVGRGELLALLGPNGAGKTTAIGCCLGLVRPDAGEATLFGDSPRALPVRVRIGAMLQSAGIPEALKVRELIEQVAAGYPSPRALDDCVALAGLDGVLERRYGKLSGGQQRRVQFALAIVGHPDLLFLDEPTTGLDLEARKMLWQTIRTMVQSGASVVLTTHYLEEAEALADRVAVIAKGRIVAEGTVAQLRARIAQRRIRCVSALDVATIAAWPEVRSVQRSEARIDVVTDAAEAVVRRLLAADERLGELEIQRAGLADAFTEITREAA